MVSSELAWMDPVISEGAAGAGLDGLGRLMSIAIVLEDTREPFDVEGWPALGRDAYHRAGAVVVKDVCTSGFDMRFDHVDGVPEFVFRWRPPPRSRVAYHALRSRWHLLSRAVLLQYPAMWWAGTRGRAPLHAAVCTSGEATVLIAGPAGVGKTTLLSRELDGGEVATTDNLCVSDGSTAWGIVEPVRSNDGIGRRMSYGRRESRLLNRVSQLEPDRVIVLRRGGSAGPRVASLPAWLAVRELVAGTYMAGELRRFWSFAATMSIGAGFGPVHPPVASVADRLGQRLPCFEVSFPSTHHLRLADVIDQAVLR